MWLIRIRISIPISIRISICIRIRIRRNHIDMRSPPVLTPSVR
jgi:hypothetical protein